MTQLNLTQQTQQTISVTPQLRQALHLLTLSTPDLLTCIQEEVLENPLLEWEEPRVDDLIEEISYTHPTTHYKQTDQQKDFDVAKPITLADHLIHQLGDQVFDPKDRSLAVALIYCLEPTGYLTETVQDLAKSLGCPMPKVQNLIDQLQKLEPVGVFACNLAECFKLQLKGRGALTPNVEKILFHLDELTTGNWERLALKAGVEIDEVIKTISLLRRLDPYPGLCYGQGTAEPVTPDLIAHKQDDQWQVDLVLPSYAGLCVQPHYRQMLDKVALPDKDFLKKKLKSAEWFRKAVQYRLQTLRRIGLYIVRHQADFLDHGIEFFRPLRLREVAQELGIHESTVSRAIQNKFLMTPHKTWPLKFFFAQELACHDGGNSYAATTVRALIQRFIDQEKPDKIISDDALCQLLQAEGITIARRTVTKYREMLHIPPSSERRRIKKIAMLNYAYKAIKSPRLQGNPQSF